jgi:hypothetical protein
MNTNCPNREDQLIFGITIIFRLLIEDDIYNLHTVSVSEFRGEEQIGGDG